VEILRELRDAGTPLYALSNFSHETFPLARALPKYGFLDWFSGIVISGEERLVKPDPRIYRVLLERHRLNAREVVYIDDNPANAAAATAVGMHGVHFTAPAALRAHLAGFGLLPAQKVTAK
jgi:2-haloacid dehalogenase